MFHDRFMDRVVLIDFTYLLVRLIIMRENTDGKFLHKEWMVSMYFFSYY